jgi:hypothetical protein
MKNILILLLLCTVTLKTFTQPVSDFILSGHKICSGNEFSLINTSTFANEYEWLIDGNHYSNAKDTTCIIFENCYELYPVMLIACDSVSGNCDSVTQYVEVFDSCFFHWTGDFFACPGDTIHLTTHPEAIHTNWNFQPAATIISGCDTCQSVSFILQQHGTMVDKTVEYNGGCSETTSFHYLCMISNLREVESSISVFPNPFSTNIKIKSDKIFRKGIIYDMIGKEIMRIEIKEETDLSLLENGVFILKLISDDNELSKGLKLIKQE